MQVDRIHKTCRGSQAEHPVRRAATCGLPLLAADAPERGGEKKDDEQGADVDLQLGRHGPQMLVGAHVLADGGVVLPGGRQGKILDIGQRAQRLAALPAPPCRRKDQQRQHQRDSNCHYQGREEPAQHADDRLDRSKSLGVEGIADLRPEEENTADKEKNIHARRDLANEDVKDHDQRDGQASQPVNVRAIGG